MAEKIPTVARANVKRECRASLSAHFMFAIVPTTKNIAVVNIHVKIYGTYVYDYFKILNGKL